MLTLPEIHRNLTLVLRDEVSEWILIRVQEAVSRGETTLEDFLHTLSILSLRFREHLEASELGIGPAISASPRICAILVDEGVVRAVAGFHVSRYATYSDDLFSLESHDSFSWEVVPPRELSKEQQELYRTLRLDGTPQERSETLALLVGECSPTSS